MEEVIAQLSAPETLLTEKLGWLVHALEWASTGIDLAAIGMLLIGGLRFILAVAWSELASRGQKRVQRLNDQRISLGRYILAGLELFIVSDVIHTALTLALLDLLTLLLLVIIRSITSWFLDRELDQVRKEMEQWPE